MGASLRVTLRKSPISHAPATRATVRALGLRRVGGSVTLPDNPAVRGMVQSVRFLVAVEEIAGEKSR